MGIMQNFPIIGTFFIIPLSLFLITGCQWDGGEIPPSTDTPLEEIGKKPTVKVAIGGKVWEIDPNLSYQATGIWTNPNPRPLTDTEEKRLNELKTQIQAFNTHIQDLETQRDEFDKELRYLQLMDQPRMKSIYNFGKPPRFSSDGKPKIIDLGEFPIEIDLPAKIRSEQ